MDGESLFAVSGFMMENGISSSSWNPFCSKPQDYSVTADVENNVFPNMNSFTAVNQSNGVHKTPSFSDIDPFPAPDWIFSPPDFYKDSTPDAFQTTPVSDSWPEEIDIFQPYKEKVDNAPANQITESSPLSNRNTESLFSSNQNTESSSLLNGNTYSTSSPNQNTESLFSSNQNIESSFLMDRDTQSSSSPNQNTDSLFSSNQNTQSTFSPLSNQNINSSSSSNHNRESLSSTNQSTESSSNQNTQSSSNQRDPLLEFILSRQKKFLAPPTFTSPCDSSFPQEASTNRDSFFEAPHISDQNSTSDDVFKTPSSTAGTSDADLRVFDPLFEPQSEVQSIQKSSLEALLINASRGLTDGGVQGTAGGETPSAYTSSGETTFRRRPPVPAPRRKSLKSLLPPPEAQVSTAVIEDDLRVYEDVLLTGQERCVEDWPENSPELSPEYKPAGKLRLRRDSLLFSETSDAGPGVDGTLKKNDKRTLGKKLRHSLLIRRSSKDKTGDELKSSETNTNSLHRGSKIIGDEFFAPDEEDQRNEAENKSKKSTKPKIITQRRGSKVKSAEAKGLTPDSKDEFTLKHADLSTFGEKNGDVKLQPQKSKSPVPHYPAKDTSAAGLKSLQGPAPIDSKYFPKDPFLNGDLGFRDRRESVDEEDRNTEEQFSVHTHEQKLKKKVSVKFVPQRGFVIGRSRIEKITKEKREEIPHLEENDEAELKGACGFTPHPHLKDEDGFDDLNDSVFPHKPHELKDDTFLKTEAGRSLSPQDFKNSYSNGYMGASSWDAMAADAEKAYPKASDGFLSDFSEKPQEMQDCRPKKPAKFKVPRFPRRNSKNTEDAEMRQNHEASEMKKPPLLQVPPLQELRRDSWGVDLDEGPQKGADAELSEDFGWEEYTPDNKPQKPKETASHRRGSKNKDFPEDFLDPPGAAAADYHLSDAAKAEWTSAQMDMKRLRDQEEEQKLEQEEDEGDTDSLMEWWNTVEYWDEIPSNDTISSKEEETISFKAVAEQVHRGLRVYLKLFMERAELLYQHVLILYAIADDLSSFHHRSKIANIAGGTTTAVGGAAAIAGLALVPVTFGASIIISAIGLGVATAGGITAASATISDNINNMHDRKKIEVIVQDYETQLVEMQRCLQFIIEGLSRLRNHALLRRNNYYTGDWEVRRALQTISLVTEPVDKAEDIITNTLLKLASLHTGIDKYFTKDMKEVKKGCKKEVTAEVRSIAKQLHQGLVELNTIRGQLLDASGNI
nr:uncharacterized protein si:cabz01007807.1 [Danio rerio]|eukprot:XP_002667295.4 uncharacterized protein si:cabz01007807.1 [Danio rerio]